MADNFIERRYELHDKLVEILGSNNVYYQIPENVKINYPCIYYKLNGLWNRRADDKSLYAKSAQYDVVVIDEDPDSTIFLDLIKEFNHCSFKTHYVSGSLHHYALTLYY